MPNSNPSNKGSGTSYAAFCSCHHSFLQLPRCPRIGLNWAKTAIPDPKPLPLGCRTKRSISYATKPLLASPSKSILNEAMPPKRLKMAENLRN